jgi:hypothetical protein
MHASTRQVTMLKWGVSNPQATTFHTLGRKVGTRHIITGVAHPEKRKQSSLKRVFRRVTKYQASRETLQFIKSEKGVLKAVPSIQRL